MPVETREISVTGKEDCGIVDITEIISEEVRKSKIRNGTVTILYWVNRSNNYNGI